MSGVTATQSQPTRPAGGHVTHEVCETLTLTDRSSSRCHYQMLLPRLSWFPFSSGECQPQEATDPPHKEAERLQTHHVVNHPAGFFFFLAASRVFSSALMLHTVSPSPGSRLRTVAHIVSLLSLDLTGCGSGVILADGALGGATLKLPSHSGQIVVLQQWSSSPAQDVTWKQILLSTIRRHHPGKSLLFKAKQPLQLGVLLFVCSPVETLLSVSMGPEDEYLTRSEQLFDQLL